MCVEQGAWKDLAGSEQQAERLVRLGICGPCHLPALPAPWSTPIVRDTAIVRLLAACGCVCSPGPCGSAEHLLT